MSATTLVWRVVLTLALGGAFAAQMLRWLRVLQREHYEPSSMSRFLGRWTSPPVASAKSVTRNKKNRPLTLSHVLAVLLFVTALLREDALVTLISIVYGLFCPTGLAIRGRTSRLQWTRRLTTIAVVSTGASIIIAVAGGFTVRPWLVAAALVWAVPVLLDVTARVLAPYEQRRANQYVERARRRLERVGPRVVAITGSYGKTSTKHHLSELLGADGGVVASPRSYNNQAGLSRAINENVADDTRLFIAEMGTYGPGEIRALCSWCRPEIAVVTAIGPVHLERMKSLEIIDQAKFEITERATTVVLNCDDERLARWIPRLQHRGIHVVAVGSRSPEASVRVVEVDATWTILIDGAVVATTPATVGIRPTNVACAIGVALELGVAREELLRRVTLLSPVLNRSQVVTAPSGVVVIDDTFNANPASAEAALELLASLSLTGRRVVVTPGLVEMGRDQYGANLSLGQKVAARRAELVIVGRTNVVPMTVGYAEPPRRFDTREEAVSWVRSALAAGDGVLYLNDLPDHYP